MKQFIEVSGEGFESLMGQRVTVFCANYIYTGKLIGINDKFIKFTEGGIVFETGGFTDKTWKNLEKLPNDFYVMIQSIESFMLLK